MKTGEARPIYFIIGCPRSGTYLLSSILNASGRIAIPTETHFVPLFQPYLWMAGNLQHLNSRRRLLRAIFIFLRIWLARAEEERSYAAVTRHSFLTIESESNRLSKSTEDYPGLVRGLFATYAQQQGAVEAGDKSAFFDHIPLEQIDAALGGRARFIHVIRDGRDVCTSWRKTKVGPRSIAEAAAAWARHVEGKRAWGKMHPERYLEVHYESLLSNPRDTLHQVCTYLGFAYTDELLEFHSKPYARDIANSTTHSQLGKPLNPANQGKWRHEFSAAEVEEFEKIAGQTLASMGYPASVQGSNTAHRWDLSWLGSHRVRLALKQLLPICALCAAWIDLPLDRICNSRIWLNLESRFTRKQATDSSNS
jgi:hypothetical protein